MKDTLPSTLFDTSPPEKNFYVGLLRVQGCPLCGRAIGDMPGSRDAVCKNCGYKDPCCGD